MLAPRRLVPYTAFLLLIASITLIVLFYSPRESLISASQFAKEKWGGYRNEPPAAHFDPTSEIVVPFDPTSPPHEDRPEELLFDHAPPPPPPAGHGPPPVEWDTPVVPDEQTQHAPIDPPPGDSEHKSDAFNPLPTHNKPPTSSSSSQPLDFDPTDPPCSALAPLAQDTLVILKTGSTELRDKFPVHTNTTLRCYPHYLIFSDHGETYLNETILDALEHVNETIKATHPDFRLWRRLQNDGRDALDAAELSGPEGTPDVKGTGHQDNPGWKLDKWKFMPMMSRTYAEYPDKEWYIFVETDTYLLWQTALNSLRALDPKELYYIGAETYIGDENFNHGGSGFAVSQAAMKKVVNLYDANQRFWEDLCDHHWAGDAVLGEAFKAAGVGVTGSYPTWQGESIGKMAYERGGVWCSPAATYHHLSADEVKELWEFEQSWIKSTKGDTTASLRHRDMYNMYFLPRIPKTSPNELPNWDNTTPTSTLHNETSLAACSQVCEMDGKCMEYAFTHDMKCYTNDRPILGGAKEGSESGWMKERIEAWARKQETCGKKMRWPGENGPAKVKNPKVGRRDDALVKRARLGRDRRWEVEG